ncbi:unnamed protein product [Rotaria sp. Silwood2]|nr:unnamed protein product [Rotaria sp. Silwood2]
MIFEVLIRTPENEILTTSVPSTPLLQSSISITNTSNKQLTQSSNNSTSGKSSSPGGVSSQSNPFAVQTRTLRVTPKIIRLRLFSFFFAAVRTINNPNSNFSRAFHLQEEKYYSF